MASWTDVLDRLDSKFTVGDDCWEWTAGRDKNGYGQFRSDDGVTTKAHRLLWELLVGSIPEGLELDHLCRNPSCVNPAHLEPVTHAENVARGQAGAHHARKTHCPRGHEYSETNTYVRPDRLNRRECIICRSDAARRYHNKEG
jgi:hypothetical protein